MSYAMEGALKVVMPWLSAGGVGVLAQTCTAMAESARIVTARRVEDASQGWETMAVPIENSVDDCLYPEFEYTPFSRPSASASAHPFAGPWGGEEMRWRRELNESEFGGAMETGSVLHGPGIGCRCSIACHMSDEGAMQRSEPSSASGGSSMLLAGNGHDSERSARSLKEVSKKRRLKQGGDGINQHGTLSDHSKDYGCVEEVSQFCNRECDDKRMGSPSRALSCRCGRLMGGELAYDSHSRLRLFTMGAACQESATGAEQVKEGGSDSKNLQQCMSSRELGRDGQAGGEKEVEQAEEPLLVMECGRVCSCNSLCKCRVSQRGLGVRVKVIRTGFKGWALSALQDIKQGTFVCEYGGELVTRSEACKRHKRYDTEIYGKHWQGSALLTIREHLPSGQASIRVNVDATRVGNVARFINHSCDGGNLMPCLIRIAGCIIPKLALFARRDIMSGVELSYSYGTADEDAETFKPCFCGTPACLGRLPREST